MNRNLLFAVLAVSSGCFNSINQVAFDAGPDCVAPTTACGGKCATLKVDSANCGTCGHACTATEACGGGTCSPKTCAASICAERQVCLNAKCVNRDCVGVSCSVGHSCFLGGCQPESCDSAPCPIGSICQSGTCTDVACGGVSCPSGQHCAIGACVDDTCTDGLQSPTESDVDCGGVCPGCAPGKACGGPADCAAGLCLGNVCSPCTSNAACPGGKACIGGACAPCTQASQCAANQSCHSDGSCGTCGGTPECRVGQVCKAGLCTTCASSGECLAPAVCQTGQCVTACTGNASCAGGLVCLGTQTCGNCAQPTQCTAPQGCRANGTCGTCTTSGDCPAGQGCAAGGCGPCTTNTQCASGFCNLSTSTCSGPTCTDGVKNGSETGVDCGGGCAACDPLAVFSDSLGGAAKTTFSAGQSIYARVSNLSATNAQSCVEVVGVSDGFCANLGSWTTFPTPDWTFDLAAGLWRAMVSPNRFPPGSYKEFFRNTQTAAQAVPVTLTLTGPVVIFSSSLDGPALTSYPANKLGYARILGLGATNAQSCVEIVGSNDGACANPPSGWTTLPNAGWSYELASGKWRAVFPANTYPPNSYRSFARDSVTGALAAPVVLTLTAPVCQWSAIVPGPVTPPSSPCTTANQNATTVFGGYTWTCTCQ